MRCIFAAAFVVIGIFACAPVRAQVYRCTAANGSVSFQDHACTAGQKQKIIDVPGHAPSGYVPPPAATAAPPIAAATALPPPIHVPPPAPLPTMYACVGAVNGKHYLTAHPPGPYLAPLGMLGYPPMGLSQAYGAHASTPRPRAASAAGAMTQVQDACKPAPKVAVCRFVQREYGENERHLRMAMPHERPPLEQRERQLSAQLTNC